MGSHCSILPVDGIGCCRRRNRPYLRIRDVVDPVYKAKSCSQLILCADGACADLPVAIFHSAEHGIVDPNQGLVHLLGDSCARWEHNTPLVHPCQTRAFFSRVRLMELKSVTWARQSISQASNQSFRASCIWRSHSSLLPVQNLREWLRAVLMPPDQQALSEDFEGLIKKWPLVVINSDTPQEALAFLSRKLPHLSHHLPPELTRFCPRAPCS